MKWLIIVLFLPAIVLGCAPQPQPPTPRTDEPVRVAAGEVFTVPLEANPSTGADWSVSYNQEMIEYLDYESETGGMPPVPGDQVYRTYKFRALKKGETKIILTYGRTRELGFARDDIWRVVEIPVTIQ